MYLVPVSVRVLLERCRIESLDQSKVNQEKYQTSSLDDSLLNPMNPRSRTYETHYYQPNYCQIKERERERENLRHQIPKRQVLIHFPHQQLLIRARTAGLCRSSSSSAIRQLSQEREENVQQQ